MASLSAKRPMARLAGLGILVFAVGAEPNPALWVTGEGFVAQAEASVGRPASPASVAGVARRTTGRVVRRTGAYVSVLPAGCVIVNINGVGYYQCGPTYFEPYGNRYVVVIVD